MATAYRISLFVILIVLIIVPDIGFTAEPDKVIDPTPLVVVNAQVSVESLSLRDLRSIFTMKKRYWDDGTPITVFVLEGDHQVHRAFCKKRLNVFPNQLESLWYRKVYTGTGRAPIILANEQQMRDRISKTSGSVGYLTENSADETNTKVLPIK